MVLRGLYENPGDGDKTGASGARHRFLSPAKINIFLKVLSKREDGYHDILSLIQPVSLYDEIFLDVRDGDGITVKCSQRDLPSDFNNLAYRAAESFLKRTGIKKRVGIEIIKNIPIAGGLGGGSTDAATVIMGLNRILGGILEEKGLLGIASSIGSDVPFFILRSPALASGRGDELKRVELPEYNYILINPGFGVSTAWAYGNLSLTKRGEDNILIYSNELLKEPESIGKYLVNDLEEVTSRKHPEIKRLKRLLLENGATGALMSGSGPTVFGVFMKEAEAFRAFDNIKRTLEPGFSIFKAHGLAGGNLSVERFSPRPPSKDF